MTPVCSVVGCGTPGFYCHEMKNETELPDETDSPECVHSVYSDPTASRRLEALS